MPITVATTQNVSIEYEIASIGERILAALIDVAVLVAYMILLSMLNDAVGYSDSIGDAVTMLLYLPVILYDLLCEIFLDGQSLGKKALKVKVVKLDGSEPTVGSYLLRWVLRLVDLFFMVGLVVIAISGKGQRFGDIAAGTTVIRLRPRMALSDVLMPVPEATYTPVYPEVLKLSDRDIAIVRDVWSASRTQDSRATVNALALRVASVMGVENSLRSPQYKGHDQFLETVIRDYSHLTSGDELIVSSSTSSGASM